MAYCGHALGMAPSDRIPEFTHIGQLVPSLISCHEHVLHPENMRPMAHDELAHVMTLDDHILSGNHEFTCVDGLTPIASFYPGLGSPP